MSKSSLKARIVSGNSRLMRGFENDEPGIPNESGEVPVLDTVEPEVDMVIDDLEDIQDQEVEIEDNIEAMESMARYYLCAQESLSYGGMSKPMAMMFDSAVKDAVRQMGLRVQGRVTPSMESFGGSGSRLKATQISMEGAKDFMKDLWKRIMAAIQTIIQKLEEWWVKIFDQAGRLKKRAEKLKARAEATNGSLKNEKDYESGATAAVLRTDKAVNETALVEDFKKLAELIKATNQGFSKNTGASYMEKISDFIGDYNNGDKAKAVATEYQASVTNYGDIVPKETTDGDKHKEKRTGYDKDSNTAETSDAYLGGKSVCVISLNNTTKTLVANISTTSVGTPVGATVSTASYSSRFGFEKSFYGLEEDVIPTHDERVAAAKAAQTAADGAPADGAPAAQANPREPNQLANHTLNPDADDKEEKVNESIKVLKLVSKVRISLVDTDPEYKKDTTNANIKASNKNSCVSVCDEIINMMDEVSAVKNALAKSREKKNKLKDAAKRAENAKTSGSDAVANANANVAASILMAAVNNFDSFPSAVAGYVIKTSKSGLNHVEKSLSMHVS